MKDETLDVADFSPGLKLGLLSHLGLEDCGKELVIRNFPVGFGWPVQVRVYTQHDCGFC